MSAEKLICDCVLSVCRSPQEKTWKNNVGVENHQSTVSKAGPSTRILEHRIKEIVIVSWKVY